MGTDQRALRMGRNGCRITFIFTMVGSGNLGQQLGLK